MLTIGNSRVVSIALFCRMAASARAAADASEHQRLENRMVATKMKSESFAMKQQHEAELVEAAMINRELVEEAQLRRHLPAEAMKKVRDSNQKKRIAIQEEIKAKLEQKAVEDEIEQARRNDLIRRIRALERVHREHVKVFDPTESGGHGLLEEMSLVELHERLQINEIREKEMVQDRRREILSSKREKEKALQARLAFIQRT